MAGKVNGVALGSIAAGSLLLYAGITGKDIPQALQSLISGQGLVANQKYPITGGSSSSGGSGSSSAAASVSPAGSIQGQAIAQNAVGYVGKLGYVWGGSFDSGSPDCSGFVNGILGKNFGLAIPLYKAGTFDGSAHGPPSSAYILWPGATHIKRADVAAGDLCVWQNPVGHIGIAISNSQLVSDLDPSQGVQVTAIDRTDTGVLFCLRLNALKTVSSGTTQSSGTTTAGGRG